MIIELGHFSFILALSLGGIAIGISVLKRPEASFLIRYVCYAQAGLLSIAFLCLSVAFLWADFSVRVVGVHSNGTMAPIYRWAALWGHHEGSMLLWTLLLSFIILVFLKSPQKIPKTFHDKALRVLQILQFFFLSYTLFFASPFERLMPFSTNGGELNPLLQDPSLTVHPILLYLGFLGFSVPYALSVAASSSFRMEVLGWIRPWLAYAGGILTLGILSGAFWAYYELGWGGWWFWDPVESASLLPWLAGLLALHACARSSRNPEVLFLTKLPFLFCLLSLWIVRGGEISSVHSFALDPTRSFCLMGIFVLFFGESVWRLKKLQDAPKKKSSFFLKGSLFSLSYLLCVVLFGIFFPWMVTKITGRETALGVGYFTYFFSYPALGMMVFMIASLKRPFDLKKVPLLLSHGGMALLALGALLNGVFQKEHLFVMGKGTTFAWKNYALTFLEGAFLSSPGYLSYEGTFSLSDASKAPILLKPQRRFYSFSQQEHSEASLCQKGLTTFSLVLAQAQDQKKWVVRLYENPGLILVWVGGVLVALGLFLQGFKRRRS